MKVNKQYLWLLWGVIIFNGILISNALAQSSTKANQPLTPATVQKIETGIANIRDACSKTDDLEAIGWSKSIEDFAQIGTAAIPDIVKTLLSKKEDYKTRFFMAVILGEVIPDTQSTPYLIKVFQDKSETELLRGECATAISFIKDTSATSALIDNLNLYNSSIPFRITIINAIGGLRDKRSVSPLLKLLDNNNKDIQMASARAIGLIGDKNATGELMKKIQENNPDNDKYINRVKLNAISALVSIGGTDVEDFLIELLANTKSNDLKIGTVIGLGTLRSNKAVPILIKQLKSDNQLLIMHSAKSLSLIGAIEAEKSIKESLNNVKSEYVKSMMGKSLDNLLKK